MPGAKYFKRKLVYTSLIAMGIGGFLISYNPGVYSIVGGLVLIILPIIYLAKYADYVKSVRETSALVALSTVFMGLGALLAYVLSGSYYSQFTATSLILALFITGLASLRLYTR